MKKDKSLNIRNSTAEFLMFTAAAGEDSVEVRYENENVWLTQKMIATLYDVTIAAINQHLKHIFADSELEKGATVKNFLIVQKEGSRKVERNVEHYSLQAVVAVGYRVNSSRAVQFRKWATGVLKTFAIQGYVLDNPGKVSAEIAKQFAESEFDKYRIVQDRLFESDFDMMIEQVGVKGEKRKKQS
ncbi:hypothetical protein BH23PAT2_BH23PAT2_09440 [soil metagenome]